MLKYSTSKPKAERPLALYSNLASKSYTIMYLPDLISMLAENSQLMRQTADVRRCKNKEEASRLKRRLPCLLPQCIMKQGQGRRADCISGLTGWVMVDIDASDQNEAHKPEEMKQNVIDHTPAVFCALSASGKGVWALFALQEGSEVNNYSLDRLMQSVRYRTGLICDHKCNDVNRLRFLAHDPNPLYNYDAPEIMLIGSAPKLKYSAVIERQMFRECHKDGDHIVACLLRRLHYDKSFGVGALSDYSNWIKAGIILSAYGEAGKTAWIILSSRSTGYQPAKICKQWESLHKYSYDRLTLGTLIHILPYFDRN